MSRGTTLTLYRVYKTFPVSDEQYERAISGYRKLHEECVRREFDPKDVPFVMSIKPDDEYETDANGVCRCVEPRTIEDYRIKHRTGFFLKDDRIWCDRLLEWDFSSSFDALVDHYNLNYYGYRNEAVIIGKQEAKEMLSAIEYILGGVWDDRLEASMHNKFVKLFTDGYQCISYWKYVNRNKTDASRRVYEFSQNGCRVTVRLPSRKKSEDYCDYAEDNESIEYWLRNFATGLRVFLEADNWSLDDKEELILVYSAWG